EPEHVFCALYRVGLLGHLHHDWVRAEARQRFLRPGEATLQPDGVLPEATHYLVHPVLSDVIGHVNPAYLRRIDPVNVVGYGRPWRGSGSVDYGATARTLCVLAADVHKFGELMRAGTDAPIRQALEDAVRAAAKGAVCAETVGDAVLIIHDDPIALGRMARHIVDDVYRAPGQALLRVALHHGAGSPRGCQSVGAVIGAGGAGVLSAVRVEPHVQPGEIWATEEFRTERAGSPWLWRTTAVPGPGGDDRFNIKKGAEPD